MLTSQNLLLRCIIKSSKSPNFLCSGCQQSCKINIANSTFRKLSDEKYFSSEAVTQPTDLVGHVPQRVKLPERFRCNKTNPADHTSDDIGLFYTIPKEDFDILCPENGSKKAFVKRHLNEYATFGESVIMVRKPALEVINFLKHTDYTLPVQRYLLYGDLGTGKSLSLIHIIHYCMKQGWLIVPTFQAWDWVTHRSKYKITQREELLDSMWKQELYDQPVRAVPWLETFKLMNKEHLSKIKTTKEYVWTKRERTSSGEPIGVLVDLGISRARLATDVIGCIMREIQIQPPETMPRTLVAVDCVNALFAETLLKVKLKGLLHVGELALVRNMKKLMSNKWSNGAVVVSTNGCFTTVKRHKSLVQHAQNTYDILGHEGFDVLDPHIPIEVPNYTEKESLSQLAYFEDRKWLTGRATTDNGRQEILQLACNNPWELAKICSPLY